MITILCLSVPKFHIKENSTDLNEISCLQSKIKYVSNVILTLSV